MKAQRLGILLDLGGKSHQELSFPRLVYNHWLIKWLNFEHTLKKTKVLHLAYNWKFCLFSPGLAQIWAQCLNKGLFGTRQSHLFNVILVSIKGSGSRANGAHGLHLPYCRGWSWDNAETDCIYVVVGNMVGLMLQIHTVIYEWGAQGYTKKHWLGNLGLKVFLSQASKSLSLWGKVVTQKVEDNNLVIWACFRLQHFGMISFVRF